MVSHIVALGYHSFYQVRAGLQIISNQEKGGVYIVFFQGVQDGGCVSVFITGVKGQVDDLILGILGIVGIELLQIIRGGISHRHLALARETKSPVAVG